MKTRPKPVTVDEIADYRELSIQIDRTQLLEEYEGIPAAVSFWGERFAISLEAHALSKLRMDREVARLRGEALKLLVGRAQKVTEGAIEAEVLQDPAYVQAVEHVAYCERAKASARALALLGKNPANMNRSDGSPLSVNAMITADAPGRLVTAIPASRAAFTSR